jgi:DNA-binding PadR family transcriptional regulator
MPSQSGLPPGILAMLILKVLANERLHGYAITPSGRKRLQEELADYRRVTQAIQTLLENARME